MEKEKKSLTRLQSRFYEKQRVRAKKMLPDREKISRTIKRARKILERLRNLPRCKKLTDNICCFCDLLSDYFDGSYQNFPLSTIVAFLAGLLYLVVPLDVLADLIPIAGWLDDAAVLGFVINAERNDIKEYLTWKQTQALNAASEIIDAEQFEVKRE